MSPQSPGENLKVHNFLHSQVAFKGQLLEAERKTQKKKSTYKWSEYFCPKYLGPFLIHRLGLALGDVYAQP